MHMTFNCILVLPVIKMSDCSVEVCWLSSRIYISYGPLKFVDYNCSAMYGYSQSRVKFVNLGYFFRYCVTCMPMFCPCRISEPSEQVDVAVTL
jgi:hypothetical protein